MGDIGSHHELYIIIGLAMKSSQTKVLNIYWPQFFETLKKSGSYLHLRCCAQDLNG